MRLENSDFVNFFEVGIKFKMPSEIKPPLKEFYDLVKNYNMENRQEERVVMLEAWLDIEVLHL